MALVFRDYDRDALERQYTVTSESLRPRRDAREARVARANARVRDARPRLLDLVYGRHPRERLDYFPAEDDFAPLAVFLHGGYWRSRSKDQFAYLAPTFTDAGVNLAVLGYPLAPEVRIADIVASCRRAFHWLLSYPSRLRFDPTRVHVIGHSAGAHLAAMMLATDWTGHGLPAEAVKSATCISGLYDLAPLALCRHLADLRLDDAEVAALSPVNLSPPRHGGLIAAVGGAESAEFHRQTEALAAAWRARGIAAQRPAAPGHHHFDVLDALITPGTPLNRAVLCAIGGPRRFR